MGVRARDALINWGRGDAASAYLAAGILRLEDATDVQPIHPQGGPDGLVDIFCTYRAVACVAAVHFRNNSTTRVTFNAIQKKFLHDLEGVKHNNREGFLFVTNADLSKTNKEKLESIGVGAGCTMCVVFSLERLVSVFDDARSYGLRQEYLGIDVTKAEEIAIEQTKALENRKLLEQHSLQMLETFKREMATFTSQAFKSEMKRILDEFDKKGS